MLLGLAVYLPSALSSGIVVLYILITYMPIGNPGYIVMLFMCLSATKLTISLADNDQM